MLCRVQNHCTGGMDDDLAFHAGSFTRIDIESKTCQCMYCHVVSHFSETNDFTDISLLFF